VIENKISRTVARETLELKLVVTKSLKALKAISEKAGSCVPCIDTAIAEGRKQIQSAIDQGIVNQILNAETKA
jgi:hypothetical protein